MRIFTLLLACFSLCGLSSENIALYYSPSCPYSQEVLSHLQEIQKRIPLKNVKANQKYKEELKRIGGYLEVPCLIIDTFALYRSGAIIDWIDEHRDQLEDCGAD